MRKFLNKYWGWFFLIVPLFLQAILFYFQMIQWLARHYEFDADAAWETLPEKVKEALKQLHGKEDNENGN